MINVFNLIVATSTECLQDWEIRVKVSRVSMHLMLIVVSDYGIEGIQFLVSCCSLRGTLASSNFRSLRVLSFLILGIRTSTLAMLSILWRGVLSQVLLEFILVLELYRLLMHAMPSIANI